MKISTAPKILYWPHLPYRAQYFLRYAWPAAQLKKHGYEVKVVDPRYTPFWDEEQMAEDLDWCDIVVMFTPKSVAGPSVLAQCIEAGKKFIADTDDDTFVVDKSNVSYGFSGTVDVPGLWTSGIQYRRDSVLKRQEHFRKTLLLCDALSVTQPILATSHEQYVRRGEIYVLPHSLDLAFYKPWERRAPEDKLRIGWQGGASHYADLKEVIEPLQELEKKHNIQLVFLGQAWSDQKKAFPDAEFHPWVDQDAFHLKLGSLDLDIGLCPIVDTDFNRGKSNLKMIEYGAFNIPSVCSQITSGPYNSPDGVDLNGKDRVLVENTDEAWFNAVEDLILDKDKRKYIGDNARETVEEFYNIEHNWRYWDECYRAVHESVVDKPLS